MVIELTHLTRHKNAYGWHVYLNKKTSRKQEEEEEEEVKYGEVTKTLY